MSFLEMPNSAHEDLPAEEVKSEDGSRSRAEEITALRLRDVKTGRFVAGAGLITKGAPTSIFETASWSIPLGWLGVEKRKDRKKKAHLDPKLSVTLKKKD